MILQSKKFKEKGQVHLELQANKQGKTILYHVHETVGNSFLVQSENFQLPARKSNLSLKSLNLYKYKYILMLKITFMQITSVDIKIRRRNLLGGN